MIEFEREDDYRHEQVEQQRLREEAEMLKTVLATKEGRFVLYQLLCSCGIYSMSYRGDVDQALVHEGQRKIGLELLQRIFTADEAAYNVMRKEFFDFEQRFVKLHEQLDEDAHG